MKYLIIAIASIQIIHLNDTLVFGTSLVRSTMIRSYLCSQYYAAYTEHSSALYQSLMVPIGYAKEAEDFLLIKYEAVTQTFDH